MVCCDMRICAIHNFTVSFSGFIVGQPNHGWQLCFPLLLHTCGPDFRLYDGSDLKTYLLMRW